MAAILFSIQQERFPVYQWLSAKKPLPNYVAFTLSHRYSIDVSGINELKIYVHFITIGETGFKRCCILFSTVRKLNVIMLVTSSISNHPMENSDSAHYCDVLMGVMASQITSLTIVYPIVYSDADQRKHQSSAWLAFVRGIHRDRWIPRTNSQLRGNVSIWWRHHDQPLNGPIM